MFPSESCESKNSRFQLAIVPSVAECCVPASCLKLLRNVKVHYNQQEISVNRNIEC